ncbi:hypothetical protein Anas_04246 [Armadillidium nasatum]|uniref:CCHC-type domain-containing protein n=1 Tax=Armadillidium nasatum TaxID=96803 RepID=A0A5N5SKS9_9CRUS|nr:hypothetical protein Anas_04246 [Armadillidium nasatum]
MASDLLMTLLSCTKSFYTNVRVRALVYLTLVTRTSKGPEGMSQLHLNAPSPFLLSEDEHSIGERWKKWRAGFQVLLDCDGGRKRCTTKGYACYMLLEPKCKKSDDDSYSDILTALDSKFSPKVSIRYERFLFRKAIQESNESTDSYVTRLKKLAASCDFNNIEDSIIDQVIAKCHSSSLRRKLLQEANITLDSLLNTARAMEAAEMQASKMEDKANNLNVAKVKNFQVREAYWKRNDNANVSNQSTVYKSKKFKCFRCGYKDHNAREIDKCPAFDKICKKCRKKGHFQSQCRTKFKVKFTEKEKSDDDISENKDCVDEFAFRVHSLGTNAKPLVVTIYMNTMPIKMQVDTAADVSLISEKVANTIPDLKIVPCKSVLKDYNGHVIHTLGKAIINVKYQDKCFNHMEVIITKGNNPSLLGLDWLRSIPLDWKNLFKVTCNTSELLGKFKGVFDGSLGTGERKCYPTLPCISVIWLRGNSKVKAVKFISIKT